MPDLDPPAPRAPRPAADVHRVDRRVANVARAAAFHTDVPGFTLRRQRLPAFADVALGPLVLPLGDVDPAR